LAGEVESDGFASLVTLALTRTGCELDMGNVTALAVSDTLRRDVKDPIESARCNLLGPWTPSLSGENPMSLAAVGDNSNDLGDEETTDGEGLVLMMKGLGLEATVPLALAGAVF
jgi:hypothetical protein